MTLVILAHFFRVRICRREKNAPGLTVPQVQVRLLSVLPKRVFDAQAALALLAYWQQRNNAAYLSHRKRRVAWLSQLP
jgi:hypothetical protein